MRLRYLLLHPVEAFRLLKHKGEILIYGVIAARKFRDVQRAERAQCFCGGNLLPFEWHPSYGVCSRCGCYVNRRPPLPDDLKRIYSFDLYWSLRQRMKGQPAIRQRVQNDIADGRVAYWLNLVKRYGPSSGQVIEVGCAHGVLLGELQQRGYTCIGVEPDTKTALWAAQNMHVDVRAGFFPHVELPPCDLFLAFDVLEHSPDPVAFMQGAASLLRPNGLALIQTPIDRYDVKPPFGERFTSAFDDVEHLFLFTDRAMQELAQRSGLEVVSLAERLWLHHEIAVFRKPDQTASSEVPRL